MRESVAARPHFALRAGTFRPEGRRGRSLLPEGEKKAVDFGRKVHRFRPKTANFSATSTTFAATAPRLGAKKRTAEQKK